MKPSSILPLETHAHSATSKPPALVGGDMLYRTRCGRRMVPARLSWEPSCATCWKRLAATCAEARQLESRARSYVASDAETAELFQRAASLWASAGQHREAANAFRAAAAACDAAANAEDAEAEKEEKA